MPRRKTRGNHEGSIDRYSRGGWRGRITIRGKSKSCYGKTRKEVAEKLDQLRITYRANGFAHGSKDTVAAFLQGWLETEVRPNKAHSTYRRYVNHVEHRVIPFMGVRRLADVDPDAIMDFYAWLRKHHSSSNAKKTAVMLTNALGYATRTKIIPTNPSAGITKPQHEPNAGEGVMYWTAKEIGRFCEAVQASRLCALFVTALGSGLRQGELFALRWSDVDLQLGKLSVRRTLEEVGGRFQYRPCKAKSLRTISIPTKVVAALEEHQIEMQTEGNFDNPEGLVFVSRKGTKLRKGNVLRRDFVPAIEEAGVPRLRFHSLRHSHATQLLAKGVSVKVVSERLGHRNIKTTLDVYSHVLPSQDESAAAAIDEIL